MKPMAALFVALCCAFTLQAMDVPGMQTVPPTQLRGTELLLPELEGGSIETPGPMWEWHFVSQPVSKAYVCVNTITGRRFTLTPIANIGLLNAETFPQFRTGVRTGMEKSGAKIVRENPMEMVVSPFHGEVYRFQFEMRVNGEKLFTTGHVIQIGEKGVVLFSYMPDSSEPAETQLLLNSLKYTPQPKPGGRNKLALKMGIYLVIGILFWAIGVAINSLMRKEINAALLAVAAVLIAAVAMGVFASMGGGNEGGGDAAYNTGYRFGQEVGTAFWSLLLFGVLAAIKKKPKPVVGFNLPD